MKLSPAHFYLKSYSLITGFREVVVSKSYLQSGPGTQGVALVLKDDRES